MTTLGIVLVPIFYFIYTFTAAQLEAMQKWSEPQPESIGWTFRVIPDPTLIGKGAKGIDGDSRDPEIEGLAPGQYMVKVYWQEKVFTDNVTIGPGDVLKIVDPKTKNEVDHAEQHPEQLEAPHHGHEGNHHSDDKTAGEKHVPADQEPAAGEPQGGPAEESRHLDPHAAQEKAAQEKGGH